MSDPRYYGFSVETKIKMLGTYYDIKDLARDMYFFRGEYDTSGKSKYILKDRSDKELVRIEAFPLSGKKHTIIQNRKEIGTYFHKVAFLKSTIEFFIGSDYFYASTIKNYSYKFSDANGEFVFSIDNRWGGSWDYLVEVSDKINPLYALIVTIAIITFDREYTDDV